MFDVRVRRVMSVCLAVLMTGLWMAPPAYAVSPTVDYVVVVRLSLKPEKGSGLDKEKGQGTNDLVIDANGTFTSGAFIQGGTWWGDAKGKVQATVILGDLQRILDSAYGPGNAVITSVRYLTCKMKGKEGKKGKPGKVSFSFKARVHFNGNWHMDIKWKSKGVEVL